MGRKPYESFVCSCGEACVMVPSKSTGTLAPITLAKYGDGNVELVFADDDRAFARPTYRIVLKTERETERRPRQLNHWARCPHADRFRR